MDGGARHEMIANYAVGDDEGVQVFDDHGAVFGSDLVFGEIQV